MKAAVIYIVLLFFADYSFANNTGDTLTHKANDQKTVSGINKKINKINKFIERRSKKRIKKLNRIERKIFEELCKIDEVAAEQFYLKPNLNSSYTVKNYRLDTLKTLEKYYIQNHGLSPENSKTQATEELLKDNANQQANYRRK
ncbi:MAG: hypothetical protein ACR2GN_05035, partial [Bacteroidia bacterium]